MIGEIWTYRAPRPNNGQIKPRPVLIIGNDSNNNLQYVDFHYVIVSSSASCGTYDVELDTATAKSIGLSCASVIKTTKIYTGAKSQFGSKIGELPEDKKKEFKKKYSDYQNDIIAHFN